ncbi:MAG: OPT/YSL family transporter [Candidatus Thorarchaeota archaeon]
MKDRTRRFLSYIFSGFIFYVLFAMVMGRYAEPAVIIALLTSFVFLYLSLYRPPPDFIGRVMIFCFSAIYIPLSFLIGIFSEMVIVAIAIALFYLVITTIFRPVITKSLLSGLFSAGALYSIILMIMGRWFHPDVVISLVTTSTLLYFTLYRKPFELKELVVAVFVTAIYLPFSLFFGIFSEMTIITIGALVIYIVMTTKVRPDPKRSFLAGLFSAGIFYTLILMAEGRWSHPDVIFALVLEISLLYLSVFRPPPDKKMLGAISFLMIMYLILSSYFAFFTEAVVMAIGGLAIYGIVRAEPKFPLTKRALGTGLIVGIVMTFMGIYLALKLGVVFLVGAEMLGAIFLSIYGVYTREENAVVVAIANSSSMVAIGVLMTYPAIAIFDTENPLFNKTLSAYDPTITLIFIIFTTGISAIFGLILLAPFRDRFEKEAWPQVQPQAECINSIGGDSEARKSVGVGIAASGAWVGTSKIVEGTTGASLSAVPHALGPIIPAAAAIPDWIGISNSPMIAGIGFFVGWKRSVIMAIGSIISILIWIFIEGANGTIAYSTHLKRPEILYFALGLFVTIILGDVLSGRKEKNLSPEEFEEHSKREEEEGAIIVDTPHKTKELPRVLRVREELFSIETFREEIREIVENPRGYLRSRRGQIPPWIAFFSMSIFMVIGIIVFWFLTPFLQSATEPLQIHWLLFIFGTPLALVSAYFTARAISETGMLAGYISDIVAIPAILFFKVTFSAITTFIGMLGAVQDSAIALLVHLKLGRLTGVRGRDIVKAVFIGAMLGTTFGSLITFQLFSVYGFGSTAFPAPAAQLFGFLVTSLEGIGEGIGLPGLGGLEGVDLLVMFLYLFSWAVGGFLAGRELSKRGLSPMSLVVGVLIPPATSVTILIGGYINYKMKEQKGLSPKTPDLQQQQIEVYDAGYSVTSRILSGIVAGEAVVTVIWVMMSALMLL